MAQRAFPWCAALALAVGAACSSARAEDPAPPAESGALEATLHANLRHVINRGVDLYQGGDIAACYRLFEGCLRTVKPLLAHRPALVKEIDDALAGVEKDAVIWRRAFRLRAALDKVRKEIKPGEKKLVEKPPAEKPPAEKPPAEKPPAEKPPVEKPPAEKPPVEKPPVGPKLLKAPRPLEDDEKPDPRPLLKAPRPLEP